jgi:hypothetical protein
MNHVRYLGKFSRSGRLLLQRLNETLQSRNIVVNWGSSLPIQGNYRVINRPSAVAIAVDKIKTLETLRLGGIPIPMYFKGSRNATLALGRGEVIYARHLTRANSGRGITVVHPGEEVPDAPLYTVGIPCKREYRVHVFQDRVIDLVAKCKRNGDNAVGDYIRNHSAGYVFTRNSVRIPDSVRDNLSSLACRAVAVLGLDFGAVDIIRGVDNQLYVLEINTAPGLTGATLARYSDAIKDIY